MTVTYSDPQWWLQFLSQQISKYGRDNDHSSYANPGLAHDLVARWAALVAMPRPNIQALRQLRDEIDAETNRQEVPIHSMWWEIRRGFDAWASPFTKASK